MEIKRFKMYQIVVAVALGIIVSSSVVNGNFTVPLVALVAGAGLAYVLKSRVREIIADERDLRIAGAAGRMTYTVSAMGLAVASIVLMSLGKTQPEYALAGQVCSYTVCGMILLYMGFYWYYGRSERA